MTLIQFFHYHCVIFINFSGLSENQVLFILPNYLIRACCRAEIDEIENRKSIEKINSWFFEKVSKIVNLSRRKKDTNS